MKEKELKEIEERCKKATPGPWKMLPPDPVNPCWYISKRQGEEEGFYIACIFNGETDADFVTHSREDIPKLINRIKDLEAQIPEWIPVEERLPEKSGYYLCWDIGIMESDESCLFIYYFDTNLKEFAPGADVLITHWMPIPKGPEEK